MVSPLSICWHEAGQDAPPTGYGGTVCSGARCPAYRVGCRGRGILPRILLQNDHPPRGGIIARGQMIEIHTAGYPLA